MSYDAQVGVSSTRLQGVVREIVGEDFEIVRQLPKVR